MDFKERLINERNELDERYHKLDSFLFSDAFNGMDVRQQGLLQIQSSAMLTYLLILNERMKIARLIPDRL